MALEREKEGRQSSPLEGEERFFLFFFVPSSCVIFFLASRVGTPYARQTSSGRMALMRRRCLTLSARALAPAAGADERMFLL